MATTQYVTAQVYGIVVMSNSALRTLETCTAILIINIAP